MPKKQNVISVCPIYNISICNKEWNQQQIQTHQWKESKNWKEFLLLSTILTPTKKRSSDSKTFRVKQNSLSRNLISQRIERRKTHTMNEETLNTFFSQKCSRKTESLSYPLQQNSLSTIPCQLKSKPINTPKIESLSNPFHHTRFQTTPQENPS